MIIRRWILLGALYLVFVVTVSGSTYAANEKADKQLLEATIAQDVEGVQDALKNDADVHTSKHLGFTPLHYAAVNGNTQIAKLLLNKGADALSRNGFGEIPLHRAALCGQVEMVSLLVGNKEGINAKDRNGNTALFLAFERDHHLDVAKVLIDAGADVNSKDNGGRTLLHHIIALAVANKSQEWVGKLCAKWLQLLLANGAELPTHECGDSWIIPAGLLP